jgi:hypothetical protein
MENTHTHGEHNHTHHEHHHDAKSKMMGHAGALEAWLVPLFAQVPHIPAGGRKVITDIVPWLSLIFGVLGLLGSLGGGALGVLFSPMMMLTGGFSSLMYFVHIIIGVVGSALGILAFNPLREMKKKGWDYSFYGLILGVISTIVSIFTMYSGGLSGVIGILIGAYLLFEIREMYNK